MADSKPAAAAGDDEPDAYTSAILRTGCYAENEALQLCYADKGRDWRACRMEMERFRTCMASWTKRQQELHALELEIEKKRAELGSGGDFGKG
ncbi:hypothetical protein DFJ74DRAFT_419091 [Hyaloraphidium curvatum]|nr:hypothetical protein DFJ74DRAFT_419091 [Hyaloraphidium curvatum]